MNAPDDLPPEALLGTKEKLGTPKILRGVNLADMVPMLDNADVVEEVIGRDSVVTVVSDPNAGKTAFLMNVAASVAAGIPCFGRDVQGGLAAYCALEGGRSFQNRCIAWRELHPDVSPGIPFKVMMDPINLRDRGDVEALRRFIKDAEQEHGERCVMVCVDTLSRSLGGGNENGSDDMGALIAGADRLRAETGAAIVFNHHFGKNPTMGARGHSNLYGAVDTEIQITRDGDLRVAEITKQRDGPTGLRFAFRLRRVVIGQNRKAKEVTAIVAEEAVLEQTATKERQLPKGAGTALRALQKAIECHGRNAPPELHVAQSVRVADLAQWRDMFGQLYGDKSEDATKKAFQRGKVTLLEAETVLISDPWVWIP